MFKQEYRLVKSLLLLEKITFLESLFIAHNEKRVKIVKLEDYMSPEEILDSASLEVREVIMEIIKIEKGYRHYQTTIEEKERQIASQIQKCIEGKAK